MGSAYLGSLAVLAFGASVVGAPPPLPVSPTSSTGVASVESRCPTFSWGEVEGASGYELVVYRLEAGGGDARPIVRRSFLGAVDSWTPTLESCLERGGRYAWSVRADNGEGASSWSAPSLIEVIAGPDEKEFLEALLIVRRYLDDRSSASGVSEAASPAGAQPESLAPPGQAPTVPLPNWAILGSVGAMTVAGEVRTVDPDGAPRVWGRGRPNGLIYGRVGAFCEKAGVTFGLTSVAVPWASVADACPAGSWVCTLGDVNGEACNTGRPDEASGDWIDCDGTLKTFNGADDHEGWIADAPNNAISRLRPAAFNERGFSVQGHLEACASLPVWCCWE